MTDPLTSLDTFTEAATRLNFTAAARALGETYDQYRRRVGMLFPRIGRSRSTG